MCKFTAGFDAASRKRYFAGLRIMSVLDLSHAVAETNRTTQTVCGERRPLLDDDDVLRGIDRFLGCAEGLHPFEHGVFADDIAEAPRELVLWMGG